jgi:hypothetical protein
VTFLKSLLALVGVLVIGVGAIWALVTLVGLQASLVWAALVGGIAWLVRTEVEKKRELTRLLAEQKRKQYVEFLDLFLQFTRKDQAEPPSPEKYREWSMRLILLGSDEVVKAWNVVRNLGDGGLSDEQASEEQKRANLIRMMRAWGTMLLEMRKDAGHPDTKLVKSDVFETFVNNFDELRAEINAELAKK